MLVVMRLAAWLATVIGVAIAAGLVDYTLRLPGWLRLVLVSLGLAWALWHVLVHIGRSVRVTPALTTLALRLERIYPEAAGRLASGVAFATGSSDPNPSPITRHLAQRTAGEVDDVLQPQQVERLLDATRMWRCVTVLAISVAAMTAVAVAAPQQTMTAFNRWARPLGDTRWPNRYAVESMTYDEVAPNNAPLSVAAQVTKGDDDTLRTWVVYRFDTPSGMTDWQRTLMTRQSDGRLAGRYQRLIEPQSNAERIELYFEAGDDHTTTQTIRLIEPPTLRQVVAEITPPDYAKAFRVHEPHYLLTPPRPAVLIDDALRGSRVTLRVHIDGSLTKLDKSPSNEQIAEWIRSNMPGLMPANTAVAASLMNVKYEIEPETTAAFAFRLSWTLTEPAQFSFNPHDAYGKAYPDQRVFRFEPRDDRAPRVTILDPAGDESVLPTAKVDLAAEAQDDVAVSNLELTAEWAKAQPLVLAHQPDVNQPRTTLNGGIDLTPLKLLPGDTVAIIAVVRDNYLLDGKSHDAVRSTPRNLTIISPDELVRQVRTDLAELRQRAIRAASTQQRLIESPADASTAQQQDELVERLDTMSRTVDTLRQRIDRNQLKDEDLGQTLDEAGRLVDQAQREAQQASDKLKRVARDPTAKDPQTQQELQQSREQQKSVKDELDKLVQLLDQGRDAYELKQKLTKLANDQQQLSDKVRQLLPKTLGRSADQLPDEDRKALEQAAREQQQLSDQAQQLTDRMRQTSSVISRQSQKPDDQATAEALRQAADTATKESLDKKMEQASQQVQQNRLAQAQRQQQDASEVIRQMLDQLGNTDKLRQEMLSRKLFELADEIKRLRDAQQAQLDRLVAAAKFDSLDAPMMTLRTNTMAVAEDARNTDRKTIPVAEALDKAVPYQATAVQELRATPVAKPAAIDAETQSLARLNEALDLAQKLAREAAQEMSNKQRKELVEEYGKVLAQQVEVLKQTEELAGTAAPQRDRRWRSSSLSTGNTQADIRVELTKIGEKVKETIVYQSVHQQMDTWAGDASASLRQAKPDAVSVFDQKMIVRSVEALIDALKQDPSEDEFAEANSGNGGQSGGQGNQPQQQPLVPPLAELKLLRTKQQMLLDMTKTYNEQPADADPQGRVLRLLTDQQTNLADVGDRLIESMNQQQQQPPKMKLPTGGDDKPEPDGGSDGAKEPQQ